MTFVVKKENNVAIAFPVEERLARRVTPDIAHKLVRVMQESALDYIEENDLGNFSEMFHHYEEFNFLSADSEADREPKKLSDAEAVSSVVTLLIRSKCILCFFQDYITNMRNGNSS